MNINCGYYDRENKGKCFNTDFACEDHTYDVAECCVTCINLEVCDRACEFVRIVNTSPKVTNNYNSTENKANISIGVEVDTEKLQQTSDILEEMAGAINDTKPNITIRNNDVVHVTINNFNESEKEYSTPLD